MREVMSEVLRRALVKIFGPGKGSDAIDCEHSEIWERWELRRLEDMLAASSLGGRADVDVGLMVNAAVERATSLRP